MFYGIAFSGIFLRLYKSKRTKLTPLFIRLLKVVEVFDVSGNLIMQNDNWSIRDNSYFINSPSHT